MQCSLSLSLSIALISMLAARSVPSMTTRHDAPDLKFSLNGRVVPIGNLANLSLNDYIREHTTFKVVSIF